MRTYYAARDMFSATTECCLAATDKMPLQYFVTVVSIERFLFHDGRHNFETGLILINVILREVTIPMKNREETAVHFLILASRGRRRQFPE